MVYFPVDLEDLQTLSTVEMTRNPLVLLLIFISLCLAAQRKLVYEIR